MERDGKVEIVHSYLAEFVDSILAVTKGGGGTYV